DGRSAGGEGRLRGEVLGRAVVEHAGRGEGLAPSDREVRGGRVELEAGDGGGRDADGRHAARVAEARGDGDAPGGGRAQEAVRRVVEARDARVARGPGGAGGEVLGRAARVEAGGAALGGGVAGGGRGGW